MTIESTKVKSGPPRRLGLVRGESAVASLGIAVAVILLAVFSASSYWMMRTQRQALTSTRESQVRAAAELLAQSSEALLSAGQVTALRRLLVDAAARYDLERCRIVVPSGDVLADAEPTRITSDLKDSAWVTAVSNVAPVEFISAAELSLALPLIVSGRGTAQLEIAATLSPPDQQLFSAQAGLGMIGVAGLVALWLTYRQFRSRLRAMGVIRESLLALHGGETMPAALAVAGDLGIEAATWNNMLTEHDHLRRQIAVDKARDCTGLLSSGHDDLAVGCDALSQGVLLVDEQTTVKYANNAAAVFLQTAREQLVGHVATPLIPDQEVLSALRAASTGLRRATCVVDRRETGGSGVLRFSMRPVSGAENCTALVVIEDVTQQRVAEEASREFVAQATHELRTPLTNVRLYLETALDEGEKDPAVRAQCLNVINQETGRLERMVGDLLSVAEIEAGSLKVSRDDVRLDQLLHEMVADYQSQAKEKDITLSLNLPPKLPVIQGDRDKLMVAVQNLLGNALKYTPDGGQVTVHAEAEKGKFVVEVSDTGIGIASEDIDRIFEKFCRAHDKRVTKITGSGLGLALAREIARLHGGDIIAQSQLDQGSTFTLTLPVAADVEMTQTH